ncbi:glycosyltransferase family 2 protein [Lactiplantibacillus plantarum]|uniref:glycosyltransferase family 2 protein n=1 Tax=Lactiplantibacillus plantarum TaxID=1590 RepID=UPI0021CB3129|nr:glycosyltransferase family 2 protein [Lactiplantibacillus plantarum]
MATYNGEQFVRQQLNSIRDQLQLQDEIIVIDDCSQDQTVSVIKSLDDSRIKLISNQVNMGPIASFEKALNLAHGDYIFLADQDDVWLPNKVATVMDYLEHGKIDLVVHDAKVVDGNLNLICKSWNKYNHNHFGKYWILTLIKNPFTGANMAFNRKVLRKCTPFPANVPMHDWWVGATSQKSGYNIKVIKQCLMLYRRHSTNVTGNGHRLRQMVMNRYHFLVAMGGYSSGHN